MLFGEQETTKTERKIIWDLSYQMRSVAAFIRICKHYDYTVTEEDHFIYFQFV